MGSTTILNETGDTTIAWTSERDAEVAEVIAKKMKAGVTFFIVDDTGAETKLKARVPRTILAAVGEKRRVIVRDQDFNALIESGKVVETSTDRRPIRSSRVSRDPAEVARSNSVGVQQRRAG